jgi:hypothetical protein
MILTAMLLGFAGSALAQQSVSANYDSLGSWHPMDPGACTAIYGGGRELCLADMYRMQQDQKIQQQQVALQRAQEETQKLRNELLRRELAQAPSAAAPTTAADFATVPGFASWHAENRWFGSDRARTEYALLYAKDLRQEQPSLAGTLFLNALSARVKEVFLPAARR